MAVETVSEIFETAIPTRLKNNPDLANKISASYQFNVSGDGGGKWLVDLTEPPGKIAAGEGKAMCVISITATDLMDIVNGKLQGQMAFMSGKLKVEGDMALAMKLGALLG